MFWLSMFIFIRSLKLIGRLPSWNCSFYVRRKYPKSIGTFISCKKRSIFRALMFPLVTAPSCSMISFDLKSALDSRLSKLTLKNSSLEGVANSMCHLPPFHIDNCLKYNQFGMIDQICKLVFRNFVNDSKYAQNDYKEKENGVYLAFTKACRPKKKNTK